MLAHTQTNKKENNFIQARGKCSQALREYSRHAAVARVERHRNNRDCLKVSIPGYRRL